MTFFRRVQCPNCGEKTPFARIPKSLRQALWGGWTCGKCGCEMDRKGGKILPGEGFWDRAWGLNARWAVAFVCILFLAGLGGGWLFFWKSVFLPEETASALAALQLFGWVILAFALLILLVEALIFIRRLKGKEELSSQANQFFMLNYVFVSAAVWFVSFPVMMLVGGMLFGDLRTQDKIIAALGKHKERLEVLEKKAGVKSEKPVPKKEIK